MHGLMTVIQLEMYQLKPIQVVLEHTKILTRDHTQELVLNAKDSLRGNLVALLKCIRLQMLGLMIVIQLEMYQLKLTQVVLEHTKMDKKDHTLVWVSNARDSLRFPMVTKRNMESTITID